MHHFHHLHHVHVSSLRHTHGVHASLASRHSWHWHTGWHPWHWHAWHSWHTIHAWKHTIWWNTRCLGSRWLIRDGAWRQQHSDMICSYLPIRQLVKLSLHFLVLDLFQPSIILSVLHLPDKLLFIRKLQDSQVCGQLVLSPQHLAPIWRFDDPIACHGDPPHVAPHLLHNRFTMGFVFTSLLLFRLPALKDPLRGGSVLGAQVLGDTIGCLDRMASQSLHTCIGSLLVQVPQDHSTSDRGRALVASAFLALCTK
mmetsp:Transcript_38252/g.89819  ORF Transcript_38252/g.89819 Transcript_38252/m.89819 type:complete len:254 (-) Transcript_38252:375-1136(-)